MRLRGQQERIPRVPDTTYLKVYWRYWQSFFFKKNGSHGARIEAVRHLAEVQNVPLSGFPGSGVCRLPLGLG